MRSSEIRVKLEEFKKTNMDEINLSLSICRSLEITKRTKKTFFFLFNATCN